MLVYLINIVIVWLISALCMFHFFDHVLVQTKAECVLVVDKWLEDKVQTLLDHLKFFEVGSFLQEITVRQDGDRKGKDVVR